MSVYLYAICGPQAVAPAVAGLRSGRLRVVRAAGLAALVSDVDAAGPIGGEQDLWQHERAVEALMSDHDLLPARFGTVVARDEDVRVLLRARAEELGQALARVAGAVEVGVRVSLAPDPAASAAREEALTGTGYMLAAKRREERVAELREIVAGALGPLARSSVALGSPAASARLASAHLVGVERLGEFRERAGRLAEELEGASLVCTGPWPPYSFVAAGGAR